MFEPIPGGDGVPPEPDWRLIFSEPDDIDLAHLQWGIVLREMQDAAILTLANGDAIQRLVQFRVVFRRASQNVSDQGAVLPPRGRRLAQYNPHWTVMKQADDTLRSLEAELGIAPLRRGKAQKVNRAKKTQRAADTYLRTVSK